MNVFHDENKAGLVTNERDDLIDRDKPNVFSLFFIIIFDFLSLFLVVCDGSHNWRGQDDDDGQCDDTNGKVDTDDF